MTAPRVRRIDSVHRLVLAVVSVSILGSSGACTHGELPSAENRDPSSSSPRDPAEAGPSTSGAASIDAGALVQGDPELCSRICGRSAELHCREAASCVHRCDTMRQLAVCQAEVRASLDCFAATPATSWTCNEHGLPAAKNGVCDEEQGRAARCLASHPPTAPR